MLIVYVFVSYLACRTIFQRDSENMNLNENPQSANYLNIYLFILLSINNQTSSLSIYTTNLRNNSWAWKEYKQ